MDAITYTDARKRMAETMDRVCETHAPVIITRRNAKAVVMMSLDDYNAIEETAYLLRSPENAKRLRESLEQARQGKVVEKDLIE